MARSIPARRNIKTHLAAGFKDWRITVKGLVERPFSLSMDDIRALPPRTQITRHDCVEGWSCIGEWTGAPLRLVLAAAKPKPEARYVVFYCADPMTAEGDPSHFYYESLSLTEAGHPQTLLAYRLNGKDAGCGAWRAGAHPRRAPAWLQAAQICPVPSNW